jgi:DNA invertase Pin-like site-specific DNA recombinase
MVIEIRSIREELSFRLVLDTSVVVQLTKGTDDMHKYDDEQNCAHDYRGKRGVVLLRVSTEEQERKYGFPSQLRSIREKLLEPLGIRIFDEEKYIIRDTNTGMEFREREELTKILEMAKRREFDVLVMDVLDRLGRTGLPREIYRAELLMNGVRTLTTKSEEHADDDSLMGQMIRLLHGFKSEEERNDILRRTQNGRRERVEGDHKLLGTHSAKYGYKFEDENHANYIIDNDLIEIGGIVLKDENGEPWTKAKVRRRIVEMVDNGGTIRGIAAYLTSQNLPTGRGEEWNSRLVQRIINNRERAMESDQPLLVYGMINVLDENDVPYTEVSIAELIYQLHDKGMNASKIARSLEKKHVPTGKETLWHPATVSHWVRDEYLIGKAGVFINCVVKEPGQKKRIEKRPQEEWIYLPEGTVPPILVTEDGKPDIALFERVQKRLEENRQTATRNNQEPYNYLLRGGFIKCGYCGGNMGTGTTSHKRKVYRCQTALNRGRCSSDLEVGKHQILAKTIDPIAWTHAIEIIRDPSIVEINVEARRTKDPNTERRQYITAELAKIKTRQSRLRDRLEDEELDDDTYTDIKRRLKELSDLKRGYESEQKIEIDIHEEWKKTQEQLSNFYKRCQEMRERIDDPDYEPDYEFKREAIKFFGIMVWVWRTNHQPRFVVELNPPSIVSSATSA